MKLIEDILSTLPDGKLIELYIGLHWTAAIVQAEGRTRCGLSATLREEHGHRHEPDVPDAGRLSEIPAKQLAALSMGEKTTLASIGVAVMNALVPLFPETWVECNASKLIASHGKGKSVALVGHFSFVDELRSSVGELHVLEQNPQAGDLPADAAPKILPNADVVAITGMTLTNHTLQDLLDLCSPEAFVVMLGPSTPLSPQLFNHGVDLLSGAVVDDIETVIKALTQGANFHQIRKAGARLVTMSKESYHNYVH